MTYATGVGSMPGEDIDEAVRTVIGELPDLPHLPELPARGAGATMTGRGVALCAELAFDLQPAGWRLTGAAGMDQRRAQSLLARDLDALEEQMQGYSGPLKVQVVGPWTLAATVERPRGDRALADVGARRELAQALAYGVTSHIGDVRRRVPGATLVVQVDEPALPAVLAGSIPTASGFHRHRSVDIPLASEALSWVFSSIAVAGATPVAHCCAADIPIGLLRGAGAQAVSVDLSVLSAVALDELGTALDAGESAYLGVVASVDASLSGLSGSLSGSRPGLSGSLSGERPVVERVLRTLDMLGFDPAEVADRLVLTPTCGLAGASGPYVRTVLPLLRRAAAALS
ncbi:MAG TPA: methionine synthase [Marmoricola sp.]